MLGWSTVLWNLFLIGLALTALLYAKNMLQGKKFSEISKKQKGLFLFFFLFFLAFFPNIAYLFTDSRHILDYCGTDDYYRRCWEAPWAVLAYFSYSVIAIPFFVFSIDQTAKIVEKSFWKKGKEIVPPIMIFLSAIGICIGLFDRLNSWDLLNPLIPIQTILSYFTNPEKLFTFTIFTIFLAGIFYFFRFFFYNAEKFFKKR